VRVQVSAVDHTAPTVMCVLALGDAISKQYGLAMAAKEVLPLLTPLLILPALSGPQFSQAMECCSYPIHSAFCRRAIMNSALIALTCLLVCTFFVLLFTILCTQTCQGVSCNKTAWLHSVVV
jgi:hypothetical protein